MNNWKSCFCAVITALIIVPAVASAQPFPNKPIKLVVGFPPGGGVDIIARSISQQLGDKLGQTIIVENRAGAGGNIAAELVARSPADGHTLLVAAISSLAISASLYKAPRYDLLKELKPVGVIATSDVRALRIIEGCRRCGIAVPDDVAVVGIGDDEVLCGLATPGLTSVTHDRSRIGQQAARMLDEAMRFGRPPSTVIYVPPAGIAIRRSSDVFAVEDADIRKALRVILCGTSSPLPDPARAKACSALCSLSRAAQLHLQGQRQRRRQRQRQLLPSCWPCSQCGARSAW
jgi:hypothetical protein